MASYTFEKRIAISADDGHIVVGSSFSTTTVLIGEILGNVNSSFFRFTAIPIPKKSTITNAYITLTSNGVANTTVCRSTIAGEADGNPAAPTSLADFNGRIRTSATISYNPVAWPNDGFTENTPDISTIIQEIINRDDWNKDNALLIFIEDNSSDAGAVRAAYDYNSSPLKSALLHIEYTIAEEDVINPLEFYLIPHQPETVFTGRVASAPSDPYTSIAYNTGVTGSFGDPITGQSIWFGSTSGGKERGVLRFKAKTGTTDGTITVAESDDVGPIIQAGDYITIKADMRLWPKYPRFVQSGTQVTIYEDFDIAYTNQTNQWRPIAVAGPPGVAFLEAGQAQISFVGNQSFALTAGATITNYLWTAKNSSEGTSTSQGTVASPVTFTWTTPGWHLVSLQVTDSNGQTHTNYTWAIIIDPASPTDVAVLNFDAISDNMDFEQGGGECSFVARGDVSINTFPEETMIVHIARGTQTTATGYWPNRTNVLFVGWILSNTVKQNPDTGEVSFRAGTIDSVMKNLSMFPASLLDRTTPTDWTQGKNLTVDRVASYLWHWRSTLSQMTSIIPSNYTGLIRRQDFGPNDIFSQLANGLMSSTWGKVASSHQGVLYHAIDYNLQNATERATVTTRKLLHKGIWVDDVFIEEISNYNWQAKQVKMSGIYYPGGQVEDVCPLFSEAPGDAPKVYGKEQNFDRLILTSQSDLDTRSGHALARLNEQYPTYRMRFVNDGSFTVVPQELFPAIIESTDNDRQLALTPNLIPRRINRSYDHANGIFTVDVDFEPETSGQPGATVVMPCSPPEQKLPSGQPVDPPSGSTEQKVSLIAGTTGTSFYYAPGVETTWQRRVNGLVDPTQLAFLDVITDPWSTFKQGYNPEKIIVWGSGKGFLVRSKDTGKNWTDRSAYLEQPSVPLWPGETGTALSSIDMIRLQGDIFSEDRLFVLASWQHTGAYHGAIAKSSDGFTFNWFNLTGTAQVRPLGLSIDKGNGQNVFVTSWESDGVTGSIYLRAHNVSDMSLANRVDLGQVTQTEIEAQTYYANPFNRTGQANELFLFGRFNQPMGFTGTPHVLLSTNAGVTGSYSIVEDTWGSDLCGAFGADKDGNYYAVRNPA